MRLWLQKILVQCSKNWFLHTSTTKNKLNQNIWQEKRILGPKNAHKKLFLGPSIHFGGQRGLLVKSCRFLASSHLPNLGPQKSRFLSIKIFFSPVTVGLLLAAFITLYSACLFVCSACLFVCLCTHQSGGKTIKLFFLISVEVNEVQQNNSFACFGHGHSHQAGD